MMNKNFNETLKIEYSYVEVEFWKKTYQFYKELSKIVRSYKVIMKPLIDLEESKIKTGF